MECNCNNNNNHKITPVIKHVYGNVLRLAIPLTKRVVEIVDGEMQVTDTDFIPSSSQPVKVILEKGVTRLSLDATMQDGNVAFIEEKGKAPVGTYSIAVTCFDDNGNPYRFKQNAVLQVFDATAEAGILPNTEFDVTTWYLDAAIFLALQGKDGVGISNIVTESSGEVGGFNIVKIYLTNGEMHSFSIMNGSGVVDDHFDINSHHPLSNDVITARFNMVDDKLSNLFGSVQYDSQRKLIVFLDKSGVKTLAYLDAKPFIKDGMVNSVYISNNTLVITFNTDAGKEAIGVPLTSVFNPNNYYNKTQVDNRLSQINALFSNYYTRNQVDNLLANIDVDGYAELDDSERLKYSQSSAVVLDTIELDVPVSVGGNMIFGAANGHIIRSRNNGAQDVTTDLGVAPQLVFLNKEDENFYRWTGTAWQQVGGSSGGYNVTYSNGVLSFNGSSQPTYNNGILTI